MSDPLFNELSQEGIVELCGGLRQPAAQLRKLHAMGLTKAHRTPRGRVRVFQGAYDTWRDPPPPAQVPAQWIVAPPRPWSETPLGRWQRTKREADAEYEALNPPPPPPTKWELARREAESKARSKENRAALVRHHTAKRRTAKLLRIPAWVDMAAIKEIYAEARRLSRETGIPHHVDHEIPLQGKLVSGLHVHNNLQILTGSENSKKRNRFEIAP